MIRKNMSGNSLVPRRPFGAGPVFIAGTRIRSGLIGGPPDLMDIIDGDLQTSIDFRSIYHEITINWLGIKRDTSLEPARNQLQLFNV